MKDLNERLLKIMETSVENGSECGLQLAVFKDGVCIVDAFAGFCTMEGVEKVGSDTLFPIFSASKGISATVIHRLKARGLLDYDAPIAKYWNGFSKNGKGDITIRHALTHTAGLHNLPNNIALGEIADWNKACSVMENMSPQSPAGSHLEYHAVSYSWLVGNPARIVTCKEFPALIKEEICDLIGDENIYIGIPDGFAKPIATLYEPNWDRNMLSYGEFAAIPNCFIPLHEKMNSPEARAACMPASTGIASALALAKHYAALTPHGLGGVKLLGEERIDIAAAPYGTDENNGVRALGYEYYNEHTFGHGGYGGAMGIADRKHSIAVGFNKNYFVGAGTFELLWAEICKEFSI